MKSERFDLKELLREAKISGSDGGQKKKQQGVDQSDINELINARKARGRKKPK